MSLARMSVLMSVAAAVSATDPCLALVGPSDWPITCSYTPGCKMSADDHLCVSKETEVWKQFATIPGLPGMAPLTPPDEKVTGVAVGDRLEFLSPAYVWLEKVPDFLKGGMFYAVDDVEAGGGLKFVCPAMSPAGSCDFAVVIFSCKPCSDTINGGLEPVLTVTNGWEARSCSPVMRVDTNPDSEFKTTIFRTTVPSGHTATTPTFPKSARFFGVISSMTPLDLCTSNPRPVGPFPDTHTCEKACPFDMGM
eukprot:TRINITY_DN263_c0_g1_i14.p2 TRINITY_DN263_c0_g1~~TRINITY_DN263_c0_g1_i14.p2  ORF type:complete len:251 (+),score=80.09 TRINITY_DN263_c0_g1_i14:59-811(+)